MKYRIILTLYVVLVQGQVNRNFDLSYMKRDQVGQVGHGISTALPLAYKGLLLSFQMNQHVCL